LKPQSRTTAELSAAAAAVVGVAVAVAATARVEAQNPMAVANPNRRLRRH